MTLDGTKFLAYLQFLIENEDLFKDQKKQEIKPIIYTSKIF